MRGRWLFPEVACAPFVAAVVLLVVNDHFLKGSGVAPGWLTGKLSDFGGLFFFPLLLAALPRVSSLVDGERRPLRKTSLAVAITATGVLFAIINLSEFWAQCYRASLAVLLRSSVAHVADPSDLIALLALPFAWAHGIRFSVEALDQR